MFVHRLAEGIAALEARDGDWVDRRGVEESLGVGKWTAWRIMKRCGAEEGPGGSLVCRRADLVERLRRFQEDRQWGPEIERRRRVERYLDGMVRYASRKHKEIARGGAAEELVSSRWKALPAGVELRRGELRIAFFGTEDFLQKVGAVVFALRNDFEAIEEFIERGSGEA